jgi:hypothetical protein
VDTGGAATGLRTAQLRVNNSSGAPITLVDLNLTIVSL